MNLRLAILGSIGLAAAACGSADQDNGGAAGTGGVSGAGGNTNGAGIVGACASPVPIVDADGTPSGLVTCADGGVDRIAATTHAFAQHDAPACAMLAEHEITGCATHADCPGARSSCVNHTPGPQGTLCQCEADCASDDDCAAGTACVGEICVAAPCRTGADCASGRCGYGSVGLCVSTMALSCRTSSDPCVADGAGCVASHCLVSEVGGFTCSEPNIACGRPLLVDGAARVAGARSRRDWSAEIAVDVRSASAAERARLAEHWAGIAALEHASVASFARFGLQLLALGAPADLVAETAAAMRDEVEHARITYALASAYAGRAIGPGPLSLSGVAIETDRRAIIEAVIREGCVGETIGAAEARAAELDARQPAVRAALGQIADDEARHAVLAWRSLAWLVGEDEGLRGVAQAVFSSVVRGGNGAAREVIAKVVRPCATAAGWMA